MIFVSFRYHYKTKMLVPVSEKHLVYRFSPEVLEKRASIVNWYLPIIENFFFINLRLALWLPKKVFILFRGEERTPHRNCSSDKCEHYSYMWGKNLWLILRTQIFICAQFCSLLAKTIFLKTFVHRCRCAIFDKLVV